MPELSRWSAFWKQALGFGFDVSALGDSHAVQQRRVALYLKLLALLWLGLYTLDAGIGVASRGPGALLEPGLAAHLGLTLALLMGFATARRANCSQSLLQVLEAAATFSMCSLSLVFMDLVPPPQEDLNAGPAFAVLITLVIRAAIVPSSGMRTLAIGAISTAMVSYAYRPHGNATDAFGEFVLPWTLAFTFASSYVSRVIYGLQRQVRQARQLGQYVLESQLGEGGMGRVYRARHNLLKRPTAVKLLLPERTSEASISRFEREVRYTSRLTHPNTVTIYDYGRTPEGLFYYAMELLEGADLSAVTRVAGPQCEGRVRHILLAIAEALTEAHGVGLVHRDIKPANIMLCEQGGILDVPKLLDFGLVKDMSLEASQAHGNQLTGTPLYLSPEAIRNPGAVDAMSDLYALGAVGYYLLTAQHVFEGQTLVQVCTKHLFETPVAPTQRLQQPVSKALEDLILECLCKDPASRPQGASELHRRLREMRGLGGWDADDKQRWWSEYGPALQTQPVLGEATSLTIEPCMPSDNSQTVSV